MRIRKRKENGELGDFVDSLGSVSKPSADEQLKALDERTVGMQAIDDYTLAAQATIDERTLGMQAIDDFTLQAQATIDDRTKGMQEIDDYTLQLVNDQAAIIAQLQADVAQLKGGV